MIGRKTFYPGVANAIAFKERTNAILIGEPTSGKDNDFWSAGSFLLPETKLTVYYSSDNNYKHPEPLIPDVIIPNTYADFDKGIDATLEYAIKH